MFVIVTLIGLVAGVLSGMLGIGGGVLVVPLLTLFAGLSIREASGTSLAALMLPVGILGVTVYLKSGSVRLSFALLLALGLFVGVYIGSRFSLLVPELFLKRTLALLMLFVAAELLLKP
jgi:uncharacterized protein